MILKAIPILSLLPLYTWSQTMETPDSLVAAIIHNNKIALHEQIMLLHQYKEKNTLSLLPSIGYDLVTNRPLVNFSLTNLISYNQRKKDLKFQSQQLKIRYQIQLVTDTITCRAYYNELNGLLENYAGQRSLLDSLSQLLQIKLEENRQLQATAEDVLKVKLDLEKFRLAVNELRNAIAAKALQLSLLIKSSFRYKLP